MKRNNVFCFPQFWMPRVRVSVQFSLRLQRGAEVGSVTACVTHNGKTFRYSLGYHRIPAWHWDKARQRMLPRTPRANEINAEIDRHLETIILFYSSAKNADTQQPTLDGLKERLVINAVRLDRRFLEYGEVIQLFGFAVRAYIESIYCYQWML